MYIPYTPSSEGIYAGEKIKQDRELAAARLQELLSSAEQRKADAQRQAELHPLAVRAKELGNQGAEQDIGLKKQEGVIKQEKAARDEDEDYTKIFPSIAAQVQHLPPSLARQVGESELGRYKKGRDMVDFLKKNNVPDAQWAEYLKKAGEAITRSSREYTQAMDVAGVRANQAERAQRETTERALAVANIRADSRASTDATNAQLRLDAQARAHQNNLERDQEKAKAARERLEFYWEKKTDRDTKVEAAKAKGTGGVKNLEHLLTSIEQDIRKENDPEVLKKLQADAKRIFEIKQALLISGKPQSDTGIEMRDGKPALTETPRAPAFPGSGASGGWGPIKRLP